MGLHVAFRLAAYGRGTMKICALVLGLVASPVVASAQAKTVVVPVGTPLAASVPDHLPLRVGTVVDARLMYPVYVGEVLAVPVSARLTGTIVGLQPEGSRRTAARLRGDFTPFCTPVVRFDHLVLADGRSVPVETSAAENGAPVYSLVPPPPRKGGLVRQQIDTGKQLVKDRLAVITGPDKRDRLTQFLYTQLPYHPQRIAKDTAWTVETTAPVSVVAPAEEAPVSATAETEAGATWTVKAFLTEKLDSGTVKMGQEIHATVAEPILHADGTVAVPQGAILVGAVTQARPARRFGRAGVLRFDFRQLQLPEGPPETVQTSLAGVDAVGGANLAMDSEGKVKPKAQDKVVVPLILLALASRPLDRDGGGDGQFGKNAVASNALGLVGFLVGTAAQQPNAAAGIGYYGTALSVYNRWIKRGEEIRFARDTRILVRTTVRRSEVLRPAVPAR